MKEVSKAKAKSTKGEELTSLSNASEAEGGAFEVGPQHPAPRTPASPVHHLDAARRL